MFASSGKVDELLVIQLLHVQRHRLAPNLQINEENTVGQGVNDERFSGMLFIIPHKFQNDPEQSEKESFTVVGAHINS